MEPYSGWLSTKAAGELLDLLELCLPFQTAMQEFHSQSILQQSSDSASTVKRQWDEIVIICSSPSSDTKEHFHIIVLTGFSELLKLLHQLPYHLGLHTVFCLLGYLPTKLKVHKVFSLKKKKTFETTELCFFKGHSIYQTDRSE